jgi:hypothetical protein
MKQDGKDIKKLDHLFNARGSSQEEMNALVESIIDSQTESKQANIRVNLEAQNNITAEEWSEIIVEITQDLEKTNKAYTKADTKISKAYAKWEDKIEKTIMDASKREKALESARKLEAVYLKNRGIIQDEVMNKNSIIYKYQTSEEELNALQAKFTQLTEQVFQSVIDTHFELIELTTEEEWKKIL